MDSLKTLSYPPSRHTGQRARLFPATIMSPEEVQAGMPPGQQGIADQLRGHWMLCGDVDHRMFELLMSSKVFTALAAGDQFRTQLVNGTSRPATESDVRGVVEGAGLPPIVKYDRRVKSGKVLDDTKLLLLPRSYSP